VKRPALREKHDGAPGDQLGIRLWLRLLSCTMVIEKRLQRRLAEQFSTTLPRFDILAALDRNPGGMMMSELSRALLVSNGNVTALIKTLVRDGYVAIAPSPSDRRASIVDITDTGRAHFAELAAAHHGWLEAMLEGVGRQEREALFDLLGELKASIAADGSGDKP
jgi:DNA-binding MarR family transcriptional regulator